MVGEWREARLGELVQLQRMLINPADHPDELFEYYSIPAYDSDRRPTLAKGSEIGSSKFAIQGEAILVSKLNPRFPRVWHVAPRTKLRAIASTEFLILKPRDRVDSRFTPISSCAEVACHGYLRKPPARFDQRRS